MLRSLTIAAGIAATLALFAVPASANPHGWGGGGWGGGHHGGGWGHGGGHHGYHHGNDRGYEDEGAWSCPDGFYYEDEECHPED